MTNLSTSEVLEKAIEAGFMVSTAYGQELNQLMPASDRGTLERFAGLINAKTLLKLERAKEALRFYGDYERNANSDGAFKIPEGEQDPFGDGLDFGAKARAALAYIEEGKE